MAMLLCKTYFRDLFLHSFADAIIKITRTMTLFISLHHNAGATERLELEASGLSFFLPS